MHNAVPKQPSSSPYVTSVGGTTITGTAGETGVSFSSGGFSNYFGQPSYQAAAVQKWYVSLSRSLALPLTPRYSRSSNRQVEPEQPTAVAVLQHVRCVAAPVYIGIPCSIAVCACV